MSVLSCHQVAELTTLDQAHLWHPFTQMQDWCAPGHQPLIITGGQGAWLIDHEGRRYLDGNSTIWTNIHGHGHPVLHAAIVEQLGRIAHVSALGFTNEPAIRLAKALVDLWPDEILTRVFFSDDGSTAIECAVKMAVQYWQQTGQPERSTFATFDMAYHGDTMGAASLGGIKIFHDRFRRFGFPTVRLVDFAALTRLPAEQVNRLAAVVIEPLIQGAAGMKTWPAGMLHVLRTWCDDRGVFLIVDEVMTAFGRTGKLFACEHEDVVPDFVALAKGLTGGTMPLAATLTTERVFRAFLGHHADQRTFYYGHSYSGHPLGCAAALANLEVFRTENTLAALQPKIAFLAESLRWLRVEHPQWISAVRQCGFIAGIDIVGETSAELGARICHAARAYGLLTRPIRNTLVLMPPLCITPDELRMAVAALSHAIRDVFKSP